MWTHKRYWLSFHRCIWGSIVNSEAYLQVCIEHMTLSVSGHLETWEEITLCKCSEYWGSTFSFVAYLQVCVEHHDLLCGDKQVNIGSGLAFSLWGLSKHRKIPKLFSDSTFWYTLYWNFSYVWTGVSDIFNNNCDPYSAITTKYSLKIQLHTSHPPIPITPPPPPPPQYICHSKQITLMQKCNNIPSARRIVKIPQAQNWIMGLCSLKSVKQIMYCL